MSFDAGERWVFFAIVACIPANPADFMAYPLPTDFIGLSYRITNYQLIKIKTQLQNYPSSYENYPK